MNAFEYLLKLIDWQLFLTLTWRDGQLGSVDKRVADVKQYLGRFAAREQVYLPDLPVATRWERGELGQRPHCHILITGLPTPDSYSLPKRMGLMGIWHRHHGLCKVRRWQAELRSELASYMTVGSDQLRLERQPTSGLITSGNEYEIVKFDRADRLEFSQALWSELQRKTGTKFEVLPVT